MIKGLGQQKASVRYNILTSGMDVMILFVLLPKYGIEGYYFSFLITHLLNFFLSIRRLVWITGERIRIKTPLLTLAATAGSTWVCMGLPAPVLRLGAFFLLFFSMLFLLGILTREDLRWLRGLIHKK